LLSSLVRAFLRNLVKNAWTSVWPRGKDAPVPRRRVPIQISVKGSPTRSSPIVRPGVRLRRLVPALAVLAALLAPGASAASGRIGASAHPTHPSTRAHGCPGANLKARTAPVAKMRAAVICLVDRQRTTRHLPPLSQSRALDRSAELWARTMVRDGVFSHGTSFATRITNAGVSWSDAGENIATGFATPQQVVAAWMASAGHCRNILDPNFLLVGVGVDPRPVRGRASGPATWTADFALAVWQRPPSSGWRPANGCPYH
jgi:uncharacterized protein YkwD